MAKPNYIINYTNSIPPIPSAPLCPSLPATSLLGPIFVPSSCSRTRARCWSQSTAPLGASVSPPTNPQKLVLHRVVFLHLVDGQ